MVMQVGKAQLSGSVTLWSNWPNKIYLQRLSDETAAGQIHRSAVRWQFETRGE